jgi:hypothetical protein
MNLFKNIDWKGMAHTAFIVIIALVIYDNYIKGEASKLLNKTSATAEV